MDMIRNRANLKTLEAIKHQIINEIRYDVRELIISQKQLAAKTGLHQSEVSALLSGNTTTFTVDRLILVLIALGHKPVVSVC